MLISHAKKVHVATTLCRYAHNIAGGIAFMLTLILTAVAHAAFSAPPAGDTTYRFTVLPKAQSHNYTPRAIVDATNRPATLRKSDGVAILRTILGMPGAVVSPDQRGPSATVSAANLPTSVLAQTPWLDIDGNGTFDASTDGVLLLRALLGFGGTAVTDGAVGTSPARSDWASVRGYLAGTCLVPGLAP